MTGINHSLGEPTDKLAEQVHSSLDTSRRFAIIANNVLFNLCNHFTVPRKIPLSRLGETHHVESEAGTVVFCVGSERETAPKRVFP